jgi:hypothetical protein
MNFPGWHAGLRVAAAALAPNMSPTETTMAILDGIKSIRSAYQGQPAVSRGRTVSLQRAVIKTSLERFPRTFGTSTEIDGDRRKAIANRHHNRHQASGNAVTPRLGRRPLPRPGR